MSACIVTAFVPIPGHPRSEAEYVRLRAKLSGLPLTVMELDADLEDCWLYQLLEWRGKQEQHFKPVTHSVGDNPRKNSLAYLIVQANKSQWLRDAASINPVPDVFVWIDAGIFHLPGLTGEMIVRFMERAAHEKAIAIPGCWERGFRYTDDYPMWRFAGGVWIVPREYIYPLDCAMKTAYADWIERYNHVTWEVNTLARVEMDEPDLPIWWYRCDTHDSTLFTHYRPTEGAMQ